jgi:hypothetical protein
MNLTNIAGCSLFRCVVWRDHFLRTVRTGLPISVIGVICLVSVSGFAILTVMASHWLVTGDAAVFAQQIENFDLGSRTVHIGYTLLGIVFARLVPFNLDFALNILSALLGALCLGIVFSIAYTIAGTISAALASSVVLLTHYLFVEYGCFAEVIVPQLFFFLLSVQLVLWNRPIGAGLSFASAFLITPSTILAVPFIMLLRPQRRFVLLWILSSIPVVIVVLTPHMQDYLYGARGILMALGRHTSTSQVVVKEIRELMGFSFFAVFIIVGFISLLASVRYRHFAICLVCLWLPQFVFGEKFLDVPVQLPLYSMLAILAGVGFDKVLHFPTRPRYVTAAGVILFALGLVVSGGWGCSRALRISRDIGSYRHAIGRMAETAEPDYIAVGDWPRGILFEHYLFRKSYTDVWINTDQLDGEWGEHYKNKSWKRLRTTLSEGKQIWLLEPPRQDIESLLRQAGYDIAPFFGGVYVANRVRTLGSDLDY